MQPHYYFSSWGSHSIWGDLGIGENYLAQVSFFLATEVSETMGTELQTHKDKQAGWTTATGQGWDVALKVPMTSSTSEALFSPVTRAFW